MWEAKAVLISELRNCGISGKRFLCREMGTSTEYG